MKQCASCLLSPVDRSWGPLRPFAGMLPQPQLPSSSAAVPAQRRQRRQRRLQPHPPINY